MRSAGLLAVTGGGDDTIHTCPVGDSIGIDRELLSGLLSKPCVWVHRLHVEEVLPRELAHQVSTSLWAPNFEFFWFLNVRIIGVMLRSVDYLS